MKVRIFALCLLFCFLTACSNGQTDYKSRIQDTREDLMSYFESYKEPLEELSEELLQILLQEEAHSINVDVENHQLVVFTDTDPSSYYSDDRREVSPRLAELLAAAEIGDSPIETVSVSLGGTTSYYSSYFESRHCTYSLSVRDGDDWVYNFELVYTEDPYSEITVPEIVEALEEHWYLVNHYWY